MEIPFSRSTFYRKFFCILKYLHLDIVQEFFNIRLLIIKNVLIIIKVTMTIGTAIIGTTIIATTTIDTIIIVTITFCITLIGQKETERSKRKIN